MTVGPDAADLAAQMAAFSNDQVATHPEWTGPGSATPIADVLTGPEGHTNVVQEPDEAAEDAAEAVEFPSESEALATGIVPDQGYFPNQAV